MAEETKASSSSDAGVWVVLVVVGLVIWGISALIGGEREGDVKFSDCRETITLKSDTLQKYYKKFTCTYTKTASDKIMAGTCVHVDLTGGLFTNSGECERAYIYEKEPELKCPQSSPYLGYDDQCYKEWDNGRVNTTQN